VIAIDKSLQDKIDQFNKEHPKEDDAKKEQPTIKQGTK